jgi:hypothetical protein
VESQGEGYVEDEWVGKEIAVGEAILRITGRAKRCILTTFAQGDLPQEPEILQSLCRQNDGNLGVYAHVVKPGSIRRGEEVFIV